MIGDSAAAADMKCYFLLFLGIGREKTINAWTTANLKCLGISKSVQRADYSCQITC